MSYSDNRILQLFTFLLAGGVFCFLTAQTTFAGTTCSFNATAGTFTSTVSCTFDNAVDGIDYGTGATNSSVLKISAGSVTIGANQTIALGSINLTGGSLVIVGGGKLLLNTPIWYQDSDNDGSYETALVATKTQPVRSVRKSTSPANLDCGPNSANAYVGSTYYGTTPFQKLNPITGATTSSYDYNCDGVETKQYQTTYSCSVAGCAAHYFTIANGWAGAAPACGASATWNTYAGAVAGTCTTNIGGAGTTCPAVTTTTPTQGCR